MSQQYLKKLNPESEFNGTTWGMIGLGVIQFFLILFTLGFGAPYAIILGYRWYANHTKLNGKQVVFEGTAWELFGKYIRWTLLTLVTLGIYSFCIPVRLEEWKISKTSLAEEDFSHTSFIPCDMPHYPAPGTVPAALPNTAAVRPVPYPQNPYVPYPGGSTLPSPRPAVAPAPRPMPMPPQRPAAMPRPAAAPRPAPRPTPVQKSAPRPTPVAPKPVQPPKRNPYEN